MKLYCVAMSTWNNWSNWLEFVPAIDEDDAKEKCTKKYSHVSDPYVIKYAVEVEVDGYEIELKQIVNKM